MVSLTLSRKQLEQLNKIVEHFNEVEHFTIENPATSAIGSTMQAEIFSDPKFEQILSKSFAISAPVSGCRNSLCASKYRSAHSAISPTEPNFLSFKNALF